MTRVRLGTRASRLARWQADWVADRLRKLNVDVELVLIATQGDRQTSKPIGALSGTGVFTKAIQQALLDRQIDLAVHSLKDLPTDSVEGLALAAVPEREAVDDVLVARDNIPLAELPERAVVGTGSLRRRAQLARYRSDLTFTELRGNVETRLQKLSAGQCDAIVLALAGLRRLGLADRVTEVLPTAIVLPAVGQGALGIEIRSDDDQTRSAIGPLDHAATHQAVAAERSLLATLGGGCLAPIAAWARLETSGLRLRAKVVAVDGSRELLGEGTAEPARAAELGREVARQLIDRGAADVLSQSRGR